MTLSGFIVRNTFRNKRRSLLTMLSISFSLLLLTLMISIWRTFYVDQVAPDASRRVIIRDRVSLAFFLPAYYRDKIRSVPGVTAVAPMTWFGGRYIDDRPEHLLRPIGHRSGRVPESRLGQDRSAGTSEWPGSGPRRGHRRCDAGQQIWLENRRPNYACWERSFRSESGIDDSRASTTAIPRRTRCISTPSIWKNR